MSRCYYDSKRIIPAPFVALSKAYQTTEDGTKIGSVWNISIQGKIVSYMGSPTSSGTFWTTSGYPADENIQETSRLKAVFRKQEALRTLFATDGYSLEWQSGDASAPIKCNPRIKEINFDSEVWFNTCSYTVTAEADVIYINGQAVGEDSFSEYIESGNESWEVETDEGTPEGLNFPRTYRLSHTISAKGKRFFNDAGALEKDAWKQARDWVAPRLGLDNTFLSSSGILDLPSYYGGHNHIRTENTDELGGTYSVTETWLLSSGNALEVFDINTRTSADTGLTTVGIDGSITGLEVRNSNLSISSYKYNNANTKFTEVSGIALSRAQNYTGLTLNVMPLSTVVGKNPVLGTITYSFEYDNRPSNLIPGARSESISLNDSLNTDVVAIVPVMGRTRGPVLQNMGTSREKIRTLDIEVIVTPPSFGNIQDALLSSKPSVAVISSGSIQQIVDAANPINAGAIKSFLNDNNERWEPKQGRYSMTKTWVWE